MRPRHQASYAGGVLIFALIFHFGLSSFADAPPLDIDAMAARMAKNQDFYKKTRDEAFAAYAAENPHPGAYDDQVRTVIRLFTYLATWGDYYGEGLWQRGANYAKAAQDHGARSVVLTSLEDCQEAQGFSSSEEEDAQDVNRRADDFLASSYPAALKLMVAHAALNNLDGYISNHSPNAASPSLQARGHFVQAWGAAYREMIKAGLPHEWLFDAGEGMQHDVEDDETSLNLLIAEQERDFNEADPKNPVRTELDGNFHVTDAWNARGGGYANTVTDQGGKLFDERLAKAAAILEPFYTQYPNELGTCHAMMNVELGQGQGRDRMELWFKRAITIDPNRFEAYQDKEWYLQPRWYGTVDDIKQFGQECVSTQNWGAKIPMVYCIGLSEASDDSGTIYTDPAVWATVEKVYRTYLGRYPQAIFFRTNFAKHAFDGGHFDVAKEQLKILGDDWDRAVLSDTRHGTMMSH
jgi:hypothetical protein